MFFKEASLRGIINRHYVVDLLDKCTVKDIIVFVGEPVSLSFRTDEEILSKISKKMLEKRKALKLSQVELAARAGVSFRTIQTLERGGNPTMINFISIARALGELQSLESLMVEAKRESKSLSPKEIHKKLKEKL